MVVIMVIIFFGCIIFLVRYYYKDREEELMNGSSFVNERPIVRIEKEKSPYVITPTQKITQQFLSGQKAPALIECNSEDIAGVLDFMAANIETLDDSAFRPANVRMRLVPRAKTRFDDASMPPFEVQPTLQKMIFAQSPKFQIGAAMNELNKRKLNERDRKPSSKSKQNKQVRNKSTPKWQKAAQKTQLGHIRDALSDIYFMAALFYKSTLLTQSCCLEDGFGS
ncbi:unnamed protein product [Toxocara canis]|uniref:Uncharacterized protein n=1 Tax=Toxocara canis TaxID=6265 RepID=A0A183V3S7_TOXCA|nr:unnamed protein product [Toxocara canis]